MRRTDWTVNGDRLIIELSTYGDVVDVSKLKLEHLCVVKSCVTLELEIYAVGPGVRVRERCVCVCVCVGGGAKILSSQAVCVLGPKCWSLGLQVSRTILRRYPCVTRIHAKIFSNAELPINKRFHGSLNRAKSTAHVKMSHVQERSNP